MKQLLAIGQPTFLQFKGGWINPSAILWVETHKQNAKMLRMGVEGREHLINLDEEDSAYLAVFLAHSTWSFNIGEEEDDEDEDLDSNEAKIGF
jgi:hypothetical protein